MHPLVRQAPANKRVQTRRRIPNVPDCNLTGLSTGRKEDALSRGVELQLGTDRRLAGESLPQMTATCTCVTGPGTSRKYNRMSSAVSSESRPIEEENVPAA